MYRINRIKNDKKEYLNEKSFNERIENKIFFNSTHNIFKYIGYNEFNVDYTFVYLINNDFKFQLNSVLLKENNTKIHILKNIIVLEHADTDMYDIYLKRNNFFIIFYLNFIEIFKQNKIITMLFCLKNYDFYLLFLGLFKYNYYVLIN